MKVQLSVSKTLERRGALAEHGARRIQERGLEIQEEYKDEVTTFKDYLGILNHVSNKCNMIVALLGV